MTHPWDNAVHDLVEFEVTLEWITIQRPIIYKVIARGEHDARTIAGRIFAQEHTITSIVKEARAVVSST